MRALSKSTLSKLMDFSTSFRTPTTINFSPIIVTVLPTVLLMVLKMERERVLPSTTGWFSLFSVMKEPYLRARGSILIKSLLVPRMGTDGKVFFSEVTVLTETEIGAAATTPSSLEIAVASETVRLDF